jgi:hypothetical protein
MAWQRINVSIRRALQGVSLADLRHRRQPLEDPDLRAGLRDTPRARGEQRG